MSKELVFLGFTECSNLKLIRLKQNSLIHLEQSSVQVSPSLPLTQFNNFIHILMLCYRYGHNTTSHLKLIYQTREMAEWFAKGTVSFDISPNLGDNFLGIALWVVYKCKTTDRDSPSSLYIRAVVMNNTKRITENYHIYVHAVVGEEQSRI